MTSTKKEGEILKADDLGRVRMPKERREAILDEFEASGLSGAKFARMVGVKYQTFAYWAARRRKAREQHSGKVVAGSVPQLRWVEAVVEKGAGARATALSVHLPGGARMEIEDTTQALLVAALLRSLSC